MTTAGDLVAGALRAALTVAPGDGIDGGEAENALAVMNAMLASWSADGFMPNAQTLEPLTLTVGQASYTIGTGAQMDTVRPDEVVNAFIRDANGSDTPLAIYTREEWEGITSKTTGSTPAGIYYDPTYPNGTLYIYPVPGISYTLWLDSLKPMPQFSSMSATMQLPGEYYEAIKYCTAERLCVEYGMQISQDLRKMISDSKARVRKKNARVKKAVFDPALLRRRGYNINTGTYW